MYSRIKVATQLSEEDVSILKGMVRRGDRLMDVAVWFGLNQARVSEIKLGKKGPGKRYRHVQPAPPEKLPPQGPYAVVPKIVADNAVVTSAIVSEIRTLLSKYESKLQHVSTSTSTT